VPRIATASALCIAVDIEEAVACDASDSCERGVCDLWWVCDTPHVCVCALAC